MVDTSPPDITFCIPTLQGHTRTHLLSQDIARTCDYAYETLIIDSGNKPRGYAVPANRLLAAGQGEIIVILNDDIRLPDGWLEPLIDEVATQGTWVCFPDQRESEGPACLCGWALAFSRHGYEALVSRDGAIYDERFILWCTDVDLAKRLHELGQPPVCVTTPKPLSHTSNATVEREDLPWTGPTGLRDIHRYMDKWGTDPNKDKYELQPVYRYRNV